MIWKTLIIHQLISLTILIYHFPRVFYLRQDDQERTSDWQTSISIIDISALKRDLSSPLNRALLRKYLFQLGVSSPSEPSFKQMMIARHLLDQEWRISIGWH